MEITALYCTVMQPFIKASQDPWIAVIWAQRVFEIHWMQHVLFKSMKSGWLHCYQRFLAFTWRGKRGLNVAGMSEWDGGKDRGPGKRLVMTFLGSRFVWKLIRILSWFEMGVVSLKVISHLCCSSAVNCSLLWTRLVLHYALSFLGCFCALSKTKTSSSDQWHYEISLSHIRNDSNG